MTEMKYVRRSNMIFSMTYYVNETTLSAAIIKTKSRYNDTNDLLPCSKWRVSYLYGLVSFKDAAIFILV